MDTKEAVVNVQHDDVVKSLTHSLSYYMLYANGSEPDPFNAKITITIDGEEVEAWFDGLVGDYDEVIEVYYRLQGIKPTRRIKVELNPLKQFVASNTITLVGD